MASPNSLGKEGRWVVLLFSQEAPWHCGQKTRTTFTGKNNGNKSPCALFACAKVIDNTAAYADNLFTKTASENGLKIYDWQRWQLGHTCTICNICQTLCTRINLREYSYNNMVQSRLRWKTRGKVLSWEYRSPRKRNSRLPVSVILCWVSWFENVLLIYYASLFVYIGNVCLFTTPRLPLHCEKNAYLFTTCISISV